MSMFTPCLMNGGEMTNCAALDPVSGRMVLGGDVEGIFTSADRGDHWLPSMGGLYNKGWLTTACIEFSQLEAAGTVYACLGIHPWSSGFFVSTDYGSNWSIRSSAVGFQGNGASPQPTGPRPGGEGYDTDRSTGHLLAQDAVGGFLYVATYNGGIMRSGSAVPGTTWKAIGLTAAGFYPRALALNPAPDGTGAYQELWAGCWDSDNTGAFGGVWHCTNAQSNPPSWAQFGTGLTATVSDLLILGNYLYALSTTAGLFRIPLTGGTWVNLNTASDGTFTLDTGPSIWTSMDGYTDSSGKHQVIIGAGNAPKPSGAANHRNIVQVTCNPGSTLTLNSHADICAFSNIDTQHVPPDNRIWWKYQGSWTYYLGGGSFVKPFILVDQSNTSNIYVAGAGGFFRTSNGGSGATGGAADWQTAVNGAALNPVLDIAFDPTPGSSHIIISADDYNVIEMTDGIGYDQSTTSVQGVVTSGPTSGHNESHCVTFDPVTALPYIGINTKYDQNAGGNVYSSPTNGPPHTWNTVGTAGTSDYATVVTGGQAPIGIIADYDGSNALYLIVVSNGAGIWRWQAGTWTQVSSAACSTPSPNRFQAPIAHTAGSPYIYVFDLGTGIWRGKTYGKSWTLIYPVTETDLRAGHLAINPTVAGELWVTTTAGMWKLANAGTALPWSSTSPPPQVAGVSTPGGICFDSSGNVYCLALPGAANPDTVLMRSSNGGGSWTQADDGSVALQCPWPRNVEISPAGVLYIAQDYNLFSYYSTVTGVPVSLSDQAGSSDTQILKSQPRTPDAAGAADLLNVVSPASNFPALNDTACAGNEGWNTYETDYLVDADAAGAIDGIKVLQPGAPGWTLPVTGTGTSGSFPTSPAAIAAARGIQPGQQFQIRKADGTLDDGGQVFTIVTE